MKNILSIKRRPSTAGEILANEYLKPYGLTQLELSELMGVCRRTVHEICNNKRGITAYTALILSRVFTEPAEYWLDLQQKSDMWSALNDPEKREKIKKARKATRK